MALLALKVADPALGELSLKVPVSNSIAHRMHSSFEMYRPRTTS